MNAKPKYHVPALEKGLDILECLSDAAVPQTQAEIARTLGRSTSEIFRMLDCLESRGYLIRDEHSSKYSLSLRLYEMAHTHSPVDQLLTVAREPMRHIAECVHESVHLSILRGDDVLILAQEESPAPIRLSISVGSRQSCLQTASGRLLVAHLPQDRQRDFLANNAPFQQMSALEKKGLMQDLVRARQDGFVVADSKFTVGVQDVSVLVGNPQLEIMAALATPLLKLLDKDHDISGILTVLQAQASIITERVGLHYADKA